MYHVANAGQLYWISNTVNLGNGEPLTVLLVNDITINDSVLASDGTVADVQKRIWVPIGDAKPFKGTFDGQGHTISGLFFNDEYESYVGLFGLVSGGDILNVHIRDSYFSGKSFIGGICGAIANSESISNITNCSSTAVVVGSDSYAGGIAGYASGTISNCYSTGNIDGDWNVAGIVGGANKCIVENCFSTGRINGSTNVDAIGFNESSSSFSNCYCMNGKTQNGFSEDAIAFSSGYICYLLNEKNRGAKSLWHTVAEPYEPEMYHLNEEETVLRELDRVAAAEGLSAGARAVVHRQIIVLKAQERTVVHLAVAHTGLQMLRAAIAEIERFQLL